ncbi:type VI secretion system tube protein TssD [Enterobacter kobei]|uniref:type VI secretion system tube protein TssD n=1 Tax=Enterobacter kobei TaxID=208224 RepID=UPI000B0B3CA7|nr:type VI secretion system tube protein TssD [Enterobacter kobei]
MAIPAYLWLKDDGGADIRGAVDVQEREGSIEVLGFGHGLHLPTDNMTGKITGTRIHSALVFEKEFDSSSPYLYKAVAKGQTLKSAEFKWYKINDAGQEVEYFNMFLEDVKVVSISPLMHDIKNPATGQSGISNGCITLPNHSHYRILMHGLLASGTVNVTAGLNAPGTIQVY